MKQHIVFLFCILLFGISYNYSTIYRLVLVSSGNVAYRQDDFLAAKERYSNILDASSGSTALEADILYNLGDALYRLGEKEQDTKRIALWETSVARFTQSLLYRQDGDTEKNLDFVKAQLKKEQDIQKEKEDQAQKEKENEKKEQMKKDKEDTEQKTGSGTDQKDSFDEKGDKDKKKEDLSTKSGDNAGEKGGTGSTQESKKENNSSEKNTGQNWSNGGAYNSLGSESKDNQLSEKDKEEVQKYTKELQQFQKQNGKLLNPEKGPETKGLSDQIRDFFGNDSFFQDMIPSNDGKKDW